MKVIFTLIFLSVLFSGIVYSQNQIYTGEMVLEKIELLNSLNAANKVSEDTQIKEALPLAGHSPADSLNLSYREYRVITNYIRLEPEKVKQVFPEAVTTSEEGVYEVDYFSLIPILLEAIGRQQALINQLNEKINKQD